MPVAVLIAGLVAIALAFAAIAAALVMETLVVKPLQGVQAAVAEIAVVGGVLAWMLQELINFIRYSVAGVNTLVGTAEKQAADWWNYLVNQTVNSQYAYWWTNLTWLVAQEGWIAWLEKYMPTLYSFTVYSLAPLATATATLANRTAGYLYGSIAPWVAQIAGQLNYVQSLVTGYLIPRVGAIGDDLTGLRRWIDANVATHGEVAQARASAVAAAGALVIPIAAAVTAIEESPCMKACEPLGEIGQLLQGLEDAALLAIMLGLVQECLHDPDAVQSALRGTVLPIIRDAAGSIGFAE